jgi:hypothetical protein
MRGIKWIPLPRKKPAEGKAHVAIAMKRRSGFRVEFIGEVDEKAARAAFDTILASQGGSK